jgi:hypothetical protein
VKRFRFEEMIGDVMLKLFAKLEDRSTDCWGFDCPICGAYQPEDKPDTNWIDSRCVNCENKVRVKFKEKDFVFV